MGYGMVSVFGQTPGNYEEYDVKGWQWAFYIQAALLLPSFIGIVLTPTQYIDIQATVRKIKIIQRLREKEEFERLEAAQKGEETDRPLNQKSTLGAIIEEVNEYEGGVKAPAKTTR